MARAPWLEARCLRQLRQQSAVPRPSSREGQVSPERPLLAFEPRGHALGVHQPGEPAGSITPRAQPQPHHARQPPALERADIAKLEVKTRRPHSLDVVGDALHQPAIDTAHEPDSEVEVGGRRPAERRRQRGAFGNESAQLVSLRFGQREPEKRPDAVYLRRTGACQCCCTQPLGATGRHEKWTCTASRPSATFGS